MLPIKRRQKRKPARKLEPEVVVAVVLHSPNREIAAEKLGVDGGNLRRLMQRDAYRTAFKEAKRAVLEEAINQLRVFEFSLSGVKRRWAPTVHIRHT